jgi:alpha,alpha-trehalase
LIPILEAFFRFKHLHDDKNDDRLFCTTFLQLRLRYAASDVQMERVFPDGKTFVDCTPKMPAAQIVQAYQALDKKQGDALKAFVMEHFAVPLAVTDGFKSDRTKPLTEHCTSLWPILTRQADAAGNTGTLIPLPNPYIVPGGRFREVYYWDSYFTMLGLQVDGQEQMVRNICDNFAHLINTVGHIPNGNRSYYLSRSQPPFFSLMVRLMQENAKTPKEANQILLDFVAPLEKEYQFWMRGSESLTAEFTATDRVVRFPNDVFMNRYWDNVPNPRPESYREDTETIRLSGRDSVTMCRHLKAGAESGWDYSSRWGASTTLKDLRTTDIAPVDLNSLMWHLEQILSDAYVVQGDVKKAELYGKRAYKRQQMLNTYFYDQTAGFYMDFDLTTKKTTSTMSLAGMFPLFFDLQPKLENKRIAEVIRTKFLKPGGVVTTLNHTGQQWDAPNGWAPLQYITIVGLRNANAHDLAIEVKDRWLRVNEKVYKNTGKMLEKYNVEDISLESGGGEYPVQDGFGWTNGVYLALKKEE